MDESGVFLDFDSYKCNYEDLERELLNDEFLLSGSCHADPGLVFYELKSRTVPEDSPPTFKTTCVNSRTHLKQQLQRERLQEEQKREAERRREQELAAAAQQDLGLTGHSVIPVTSAASIVPQNIHSFGVQVPPQVLQVRTALENPTRYHVMQKQKSQVRRYLTESIQQMDTLPHPTTTAASPESIATSASEIIVDTIDRNCTDHHLSPLH